MRKLFILTTVAAVAVLAGVVAYRLSADALAMIVGVVLGLVALIPTLLITMMMLRKDQHQDDERTTPMYQQPQSPVVVVSGGYPAPFMQPQVNGQQAPQQAQGMLPPPPMQQPRQFRVMGYESTNGTVDLPNSEWSEQG